jgi:parallel beta-helix repeat protein
VQNNLIGTDGTNALGNVFGVLLNQVSVNTVGGTVPGGGPSNTIAGNSQSGVEIVGGGGNFVVQNNIGTDAAGDAAVQFASADASGNLAQPTGIFISNSTSNQIADNIVSGNAVTGVEIFGAQSTTNSVAGNLIGAGGTFLGGNPVATNPIVLRVPGNLMSGDDVYSTQNRQDNGVLISDSPGNTVGGTVPGGGPSNTILSNLDGVVITGANAKGNTIVNNAIGPDPATDDTKPTDRLGNYFGVEIEGASNNVILKNFVRRNISIGVAIIGAQATGNMVKQNTISVNGAYGNMLPDGGVQVTTAVPGISQIFGTGVYIESAQNNIIGSQSRSGKKGPREIPGDMNFINDNRLVGVYLFSGALGNQVRSNEINGAFQTGGIAPGDYGILLYNSAGNVVAVDRAGPFMNKVRNNSIAQFREYTGPLIKKPNILPGGPLHTRHRGKAHALRVAPAIRGAGAPHGHGATASGTQA